MNNIYDKNISKAIEDAGYKPFVIREKEYNNDICDEIEVEIRKSKFILTKSFGYFWMRGKLLRRVLDNLIVRNLPNG